MGAAGQAGINPNVCFANVGPASYLQTPIRAFGANRPLTQGARFATYVIESS